MRTLEIIKTTSAWKAEYNNLDATTDLGMAIYRSIWIKIINVYIIILLLSRDIGLKDVNLLIHKHKKTSHKERS